MSPDKPIQIDLAAVLESRLGRRAAFVPRFLVRMLERLIHQDELNALLRHNFPLRGADFCDGVMTELGVSLDVRGAERLPASPRVLLVSNHPLGGLDGISMISWLSHRYGTPVRFVVNDLLMAVEPLRESFIPVNKHGAQNRDSARELDAAMASDGPVAIFPAGLCSRRQPDGTVADLRWNKMCVAKAIEYRRDIVPLFFDGLNSPSFYRTARLREKSGIKFNIEMVLLPREVIRSRGRRFTLTVGDPIPWQSLRGGTEAPATAAMLRQTVYDIPKKYPK